MQLMAVAYGGRLHQHLPDVLGHDRPPAGLAGPKFGVAPGRRRSRGSPGARRSSATRSTVNSFHHQGVADPGGSPGRLVPRRRAHRDRRGPERAFAIGVQWHPEDTADFRLFAALVGGGARSAAPPRHARRGHDGEDLRRDRRPAAGVHRGAADVLRGHRAVRAGGHVNLSPKGMTGSFVVLGDAPRRLPRLPRQRRGDDRPPARQRADHDHVLRVRRAAEDRPAARARAAPCRSTTRGAPTLLAAFPDPPDLHGLRSVITSRWTGSATPAATRCR